MIFLGFAHPVYTTYYIIPQDGDHLLAGFCTYKIIAKKKNNIHWRLLELYFNPSRQNTLAINISAQHVYA